MKVFSVEEKAEMLDWLEDYAMNWKPPADAAPWDSGWRLKIENGVSVIEAIVNERQILERHRMAGFNALVAAYTPSEEVSHD